MRHWLSQSQMEQSNITFVGDNAEAYAGMPSLNITALSNYSYALDQFAFGLIYRDASGQPTSASFT